jgi:hypothetical protein
MLQIIAVSIGSNTSVTNPPMTAFFNLFNVDDMKYIFKSLYIYLNCKSENFIKK